VNVPIFAMWLLSLSLLGLCATSKAVQYDVTKPQIWPAASGQELYSSPNQIVRTLSLDQFDFNVESGVDPQLRPSTRFNEIVDHAQRRFQRSLQASVPLAGHNESLFPVNPNHKQLWPLTGIHITVANVSQDTLFHSIDESYELEVRPVLDNEPVVLLSSLTVYGALRGLQSLLQLFSFGWLQRSNENDSGTPVFILDNSPLLIRDAPAYPYRGLMIDSSRHFLPLSLIVKNLNVMEMNKLNVLHWHMVDSQSWPYQSVRYPELSKKGAYCDECVYSQSDIALVVHRAGLRGIRVIPEFDVPGHTQAIAPSHPEIMSSCQGDSHEPLNVTSERAYNFVTSLYGEVADLFSDSFVHVGGDEVNVDCWRESKDVQRWMKGQNMTDESQLQQYFEDYLFSYLVHGGNNIKARTPIAWQEVLDNSQQYPFQRRFPFGEYMNRDLVLDIWKEWIRRETIRSATSLGYQVLVSSCWYLDHLNLAVHNLYQCQIWDFDMDDNYFNNNSTRQHLLQGGHASMWGERVDDTNFWQRVWPRTSAVAEQLWTAPNRTKRIYDRKGKQIIDSYLQRLEKFRCFMVLRGVPASPFQPGFCREAAERSAVYVARVE